MNSDSASPGSNPGPPAILSPSSETDICSRYFGKTARKQEQKRNIAAKAEAQKPAQPWRKPLALYIGDQDPERDGIAIDWWAQYRFEGAIDKSGGPDACWPFGGGLSGFGYGRFKIRSRLVSPHRVAYAIAHGGLTPDDSYHGGMVMHRCDNPVCCNPKHLVLGSAQQNAQDMARKGRAYSQSEKFRERKAASTPVRLAAPVRRAG